MIPNPDTQSLAGDSRSPFSDSQRVETISTIRGVQGRFCQSRNAVSSILYAARRSSPALTIPSKELVIVKMKEYQG